jgi:hypothetical protein
MKIPPSGERENSFAWIRIIRLVEAELKNIYAEARAKINEREENANPGNS